MSKARSSPTPGPRNRSRTAPEPPPAKVQPLLRAALAARRRARAPWSRFRVGAAVLTRSGRIFSGANVESASFGLTCCAERVALFKTLTECNEPIVAVAVVARLAGGPTPCGACRQLLAEYAPAAWVFLADSRSLRHRRAFRVTALLPDAFLRF